MTSQSGNGPSAAITLGQPSLKLRTAEQFLSPTGKEITVSVKVSISFIKLTETVCYPSVVDVSSL